MIINLGFKQKREKNDRLPPGQYETRDFPVLSLGPTPKVEADDWSIAINGLVETPTKLTFKQLTKIPSEKVISDIHCVTKWSKFDTHWTGCSFEEIIKLVKPKQSAKFVLAFSEDGYSTNIPLDDLLGGKGHVIWEYEDKPIPFEHGGPVRLFVPHLYFWKSAKWLNSIKFIDHDEPGFWEVRGYHIYGDPWKEQRYTND